MRAEMPPEPPRDCARCPRLSTFREENRRAHPSFFNAPVPAFGTADARLLVVGLAPGLKGANRTGRPFTGDYAGDLLYPKLIEVGLARGAYAMTAGDGLELLGCRITNAVRCVPPRNKPTGEEVRTCRTHYLSAEIRALPELRAILALGRIAHDSVLSVLNLKRAGHPFAHGRIHELPDGLLLADSYHCSRYNVNTGRLTADMFTEVLRDVSQRLW